MKRRGPRTKWQRIIREGKGVDGYATVTAEQQEVAAYVFADTQKTGA